VATLVAIVLPSTLFAQAVGETAGTTSVLTRMPWPIQLLALDFSQDGSLLVTGGDAVRVHDVATGKMLQEFKVPEQVRSIACSPVSRDLFAVGRNDGAIGLYRIGADEPIRELPGDGQMVLDLAFSPDGTQLVCSGTKYSADRKARGDVRLWDVDKGTLLHSLEFADFGISCFAYSADGQHLGIARNPKDGDPKSTAVAELYDVREWRLVRSIPFEPGFALGFDFTPDGSKLLIVGGVCVPLKPGSCQPTGKIWVVDLADDQPARRIDVDPRSYFRTARITPAGDLFATGTAEVRVRPGELALVSMIQVRRLDTGEVVWSRDGEVGDPNGVTVSPDGDLVAGCTDRQVQIFRASTGDLVRTIDIGNAP
jgi:WD40 repeat protein